MNFTDFISNNRTTAKKPTADIRSRWASRIVARNLQAQGRAGAQVYLRDYGKGISVTKVIALAIQAECEGCDDMAIGFWAMAYALETGLTVELPQTEAKVPSTVAAHQPASTFPNLPPHLQPGSIITMQPVDAAGTHDDYIHNPIYCGHSLQAP